MNKFQLIQGDCLEVMKDIPAGSVDAVITDVPYGTTVCKWDSVIPFEPMWEHLKRIIKPNGATVLFGIQPFTSALIMSNPKMFKYEWVWEKNRKTNHLNARNMPMTGHEIIAVFYDLQPVYNPQKKKRTIELKAGNTRNSKSTVYGKEKEFNKDRQSDTLMPDKIIRNIDTVHPSIKGGSYHPTQKPVKLIEYLIRTYTNEGETILDFTMGSGTTGVACHQTGRNFIGIELDKGYFEIAKKRIEQAQLQERLF